MNEKDFESNDESTKSSTLTKQNMALRPPDGGGGERPIDPPPPPDDPPVSLNQVSPIAGAVAGGISITLTGSGFQPGAAVYFGSSPATQVTVESDAVIRAVVPAASGTGSVSVSVINPDGSSATLPGGFTYVASESGEQAEVLGITPLAIVEDTNTVVTIRGRNLIEAYTSGVLALRGPSRCQITFLGTTTSHDESSGIDTVQMNVNIKCAPALAPLERMAIQVLASRRPEAANDGVVESSRQMFTVLPKAVPVTLAYTANLEAGKPNLVMVSGRNLDGHSLALDDGTEVLFQKNDGNFLSGIVTLPEKLDASSPLRLSMLDSGGAKVAEYQMDVAPERGIASPKSDRNFASLAPVSDELAVNLTAVPNQQFVGPTANDSAAFSVASASPFDFGFNWGNFEITIIDVTIILPIVNEVYLISFFDGGGDALNSPVVAEVGKLFRLRGAGLLVAIRIEVSIHIQVVLIIGFYYQIWNYGFYNEFPEYGWSIGSVVIGIEIYIEVIFYLSVLVAIVKPNGQLRVLAAVNLTLGIDFSIDEGGHLNFDPIFTHYVQIIGITPTPNNFQPCGGKFQLLADDNGQVAFLDSLGGYESYYFVREAGTCCVPWDFNMQLVRFSSSGQEEVVQSAFQDSYCVDATESPIQYDIVITSEPPPTGFPPTLEMDIGDTATLKALAVPVDANGNPTGAPVQDLRDLGYGVDFFLALPVDQVLDPTTLPPGRADAILQGDNLIRAAVTSVRVVDDEPALAFWGNSIYGFRRAPSEGEEPRLIAGGLSVTVNPPVTEIEVEPTLAYYDDQGKLQPATDIERFEPHEVQRQYVLAAKVKLPPNTTLPVTLRKLKLDEKKIQITENGVLVDKPPLQFPDPNLSLPPNQRNNPKTMISRDDFQRGRDQESDIAKFFSGELVGQTAISLTINQGDDLTKPIAFTNGKIIPNQYEESTTRGVLIKLVPPGSKVKNGDVIVKLAFSKDSSDNNRDFSLKKSSLSLPVRNEETFEEYLRVFDEIRKVIADRGAANTTGGKLRDFAQQLHAKLKTQGLSNSLLKSEGQELWKLGCDFVQGTSGISGIKDDRLLYYARIHSTAVLRAHAKRIGTTLSEQSLNIFEWSSRGLETSDGINCFIKFNSTNSRKVIVTGFDPFLLPGEPARVNPSGIIALDFNNNPNKSFGSASSPAEVRTAVFPVRFKDFGNNGEGLVENVMKEGIKSSTLIMTCSRGGFNYDVDRFATRFRTKQVYDNEHLLSPTNLPLGSGVPYFIESTLPYESVISQNNQRKLDGPDGTNANPLVINQGYWLYSYDQRDANGNLIEADGKYHEDSVFGQPRAYQKAADQPDNEEVYYGSGQNYLSNEIFYRTARVRKDNRPTLPTGHLHLPIISLFTKLNVYADLQSKGERLISGVTTILKDFLRFAFALTGTTEVNFPDTAVHSGGTAGTLSLANPADNSSAIEIASVEFSTPGVFQTTNSLPVVIQPGASATLAFKFIPTEARDYAEIAKLKKADGTVLYIVNLKGKGIAAIPKINSFSPTSGREGAIVTISGESLGGATNVRIGDASVNWFSVDSDAQITVEIPGGAFTDFIYVETQNGTAVSATAFRIFIRPPREPWDV